MRFSESKNLQKYIFPNVTKNVSTMFGGVLSVFPRRRRGRGEAPQATLNIVETFSVTFGKIFFDDFSTLKISFSVFYDGQSKDLDFGQRWHKYRTATFFFRTSALKSGFLELWSSDLENVGCFGKLRAASFT